MRVLAGAQWRARAADHRERVVAITGPHRERARRGESHPVLDFLFTYYSHRPARLERWHPGPGIVLAGAPDAPGSPPPAAPSTPPRRPASPRGPPRCASG